jgi:hypothetical protein
MWAVAADPSRNLVELKFAGRVAPAELESGMLRVEAALQTLKPGFCLLTDLSELSDMAWECRPFIDAVMDKLSQYGIGKVVRVIPDPGKDIGFGIMSLFHYREDVRVVTCETLAEAHEALA